MVGRRKSSLACVRSSDSQTNKFPYLSHADERYQIPALRFVRSTPSIIAFWMAKRHARIVARKGWDRCAMLEKVLRGGLEIKQTTIWAPRRRKYSTYTLIIANHYTYTSISMVNENARTGSDLGRKSKCCKTVRLHDWVPGRPNNAREIAS